jgi:spore coat protein CotF
MGTGMAAQATSRGNFTLPRRRFVMPELTPSELLQIHEIALSHDACIEKLSAYLSMVQDPELATMIRHARQKVTTHYEEIIDIAEGAPLNRRFEQLDGGLSGRSRRDLSQSTTAVQPEPRRGFSDRTIATDCLDSAKNMAVRAIWAATEVSHVGLRRALSEMSRFHLDSAYEFYKYMEQQGWYAPLKAGENPEKWFRETHRSMSPERQPAYS